MADATSNPSPTPLTGGLEKAGPRFGRKELARRTNLFLQRRKGVLKNEESEEVHQMRIASRRLRTTLDAYRSIAAHKALKRAYQQVSEVARSLGKARDADVLKQRVEVLLAQASTAEHAGGDWLLKRLSTYRTNLQRELETFLRKFDKKALKDAMTTGLPKRAPSAEVFLLTARKLAYARLEEWSRWSEQVGTPYAVKELHGLRIAVKRLRYTLESFSDYFLEEWSAIRAELVVIQEELGALHESDLLIALLRLCLSLQENPTYARILSRAQNTRGSVLPPSLVAAMLHPSTMPTAVERSGLERLLRQQELLREEQYQIFYGHWLRLQEQHFHHQMCELLE